MKLSNSFFPAPLGSGFPTNVCLFFVVLEMDSMFAYLKTLLRHPARFM